MAVHFHDESGKGNPPRRSIIRNWIKEVIRSHHRAEGNLNIIFTSDNALLELNRGYLGRDDLTDVISFHYNDHGPVNGDIYISLERVRENADCFNVLFDLELHRVIIHGVLHLLGWEDASPAEREKMRKMEDKALSLLGKLDKSMRISD